MVARLSTSEIVDLELRSLRLMLGDLPEVASEWEQLSSGERVGWSVDWDQVMGALSAVLDPCYRTTEMTANQRTRYEALLSDLEKALPTIHGIELNPPTISLERCRPDLNGTRA